MNTEEIKDKLSKIALKFQDEIFSFIDYYCWIGGGAIVDLVIFNKITHDYDIFFPASSIDDLLKTLRKFEKSGISDFVSIEDHIFSFMWRGKKINLVCKLICDDVYEFIRFCDLSVSSIAIDSLNHIYMSSSWFDDISNMKIRLGTIMYPLQTLKRIIKYTRKGFTIEDEELVNFINQFVNILSFEIPEEYRSKIIHNLKQGLQL